ncbi:MAG: type IV pilus assembly protein PilM [Verrucomicrobiales bacterium]|nr:type IV pilus assembly protein PilM [Verrucomicrobiales bacterium]
MADKKSIVTLDIGSQRVTMARFSLSKGSLILQNYSYQYLVGDPAADSARISQVSAAVKELASTLGLSGSDVYYTISGHAVFTRFLSLPSKLKGPDLRQLVEFEAQQNVPFPIEEVTWDFQRVSSSDSNDEAEVLLVAIKNDAIDEINEAVEDGSLVGKRVDVAPVALFNAFKFSYPETEDAALLIDVGARTTDLIYIEGKRVYTRSVPVGGAAASSAIAKEFDMSFADAEERKMQDGFVSLGGAAADHEDPGIAAMSKVIRTTMTRLHSEIMRTTGNYRQAGGSAPTIAYLCGGSAAMPYLREFLAEKLGFEVEYFNALSSIEIGPGVDAEEVGKDAHNLGELVGLALRDVGSDNISIDLAPNDILSRRELDKKKPFLFAAAACWFVLLIMGVLYYNNGKSMAQSNLNQLDGAQDVLSGYAGKIDKVEAEEEKGADEAKPIEAAVKGRTAHIEILNHLNSIVQNDNVWFVQIEPLFQGFPEKDATKLGEKDVSGKFKKSKKKKNVGAPDANVITHFRLYGMYRESSQSLYGFQERLKESVIFDVKEMDENNRRVVEKGTNEYAGMVRYDLPLVEPIHTNKAN